MTEPKKSGSLLVFRPIAPTPDNDGFDYQILFLIRNKSMTFANTAAFPGGKIEPADNKFLSEDPRYSIGAYKAASPLHNLFKISALRETYEETGLFFTKNDIKHDDSQVKQLLSSHNANKTVPDFYNLAKELGLAWEDGIVEFLRMITPVVFKHRFDTQFFIIKADPSKTLNVFSGLVDGNDVRNLDKLKINLSESSQYMWINPQQAINMHLTHKLQLAPPQVMMMNILLSFKRYIDVEKYLLNVKAEAKRDEEGQFTKDYPLIFPIIPTIHFTKEEKYVQANLRTFYMFLYDAEYDIEQSLKKEQSEIFRNELEKHYSTIIREPKDRLRVYEQNAKEDKPTGGEAVIIGGTKSPLRFLRSTKHLAIQPSL